MTFTKEQNTHHLKIYPEHFGAVLTGVKRAELRKNDRDFKVGDTLHLMETPKGSCSPTGEFVNAVVTHIADVGDWLPGYVLLSIERETGYTAPPAPVSVPAAMEMDDDFDSAFEHGKAVGWNAYRAAMLQGAAGNSPAIPDGWVMVPVDMSPEQMRAVQINSELGAYAAAELTGAYSLFREFWDVAVAAAPQQEVK